MNNKEKCSQFKKMIHDEKILVAPGIYDSFSAKMAERIGFKTAYLGGSCVSMTKLGIADTGLITYKEIIEHARYIVEATNISIFADGDNGYGNALNVQRTVREYEAAGLVGMQLDDLILPKRYCKPDKQIITREEMEGKIKAAVDARINEDFTIIYRTLGRVNQDLDEAIERSNIAVKAGADVVFVEGLDSEEEIDRVAKEVKAPLLISMNEKRFTSNFTAKEMEQKGYSIGLFPVTAIKAAVENVEKVLKQLKEEESVINCKNQIMDTTRFYDYLDLDKCKETEKKYIPYKNNL
ncbi:MAG: oxaloacetate decarboxylase [Marinisporobacter sp.]|jgi:2-methylisocitrate lyase-like PEP mutase family enzyme|nr:oxaloacetate decarboxylase [Marinisporobacter sp.]